MIRIVTLLLFIPFFFSSCDFVQDVFNGDKDRIDFTSIDEYPVFTSCEHLETLKYKKMCFEKTVAGIIQADLEKIVFTTDYSISDAIIVHFDVNNKGEPSLHKIETSELVKKSLPELEHIIQESIASFPTLTPAKKQDINVSCRFMIPIYIVD